MTGENVCQKGRTGYDSNVVSTDTVKSSTRDQSKATQEDYKLIPNCQAMCLFLTDGPIIFVAWDHRLIAGPFCEGGLIAGGIGVREGRQTCFFTVSAERSLLTLRHEWRRMHKTVQCFGLRLVKNKGLDFRRPSPMRSHDMTRCWQIVWKIRQKEYWTIQKP